MLAGEWADCYIHAVQTPPKVALAIGFLSAALALAKPAKALAQTQSAGSCSARAGPRQLYRSLQAIRADGANVYAVHDLTVRRDGVAFTFADGKFAFLQPADGCITGAVFIGRGRVFAIPPDPAERASIARFLKVPLLDTEFWQAYLRFDQTAVVEIQHSLVAQNAVASSDADFANDWNSIVPRLNANATLRVLEGLLSSMPDAYFNAALNSTTVGGFDVVLDERRAETVLVGQPRQTTDGDFFDVWTSYTATNAPPHVREFDALDYAADTTIGDDLTLTGDTTLHLECLTGGQRILEFELSRFLQVQAVTDGQGQPLEFFQNEDMRRQEIARRGNDLLFIALPQQAVAGQQYELRVSYHGTVIQDDGNGVYFVGARGSWYPHLAGADQFSSFDLKFRWPKRLTLVATGRKIEGGEEGGQRTGHWDSTEPIVFAGFNLGDYAVQSVGAKPVIQVFANQQLEQSIVDRLRGSTPNQPGEFQPLPSPAMVLKRLGTQLLDSVQYTRRSTGDFLFPSSMSPRFPDHSDRGGLACFISPLLFFCPRKRSSRRVWRNARKRKCSGLFRSTKQFISGGATW